MNIDVKRALENFLLDEQKRFPTVSIEQRDNWIKDIEGNIKATLEDNDIFFDFKPDDVKEVEETGLIRTNVRL